LKRANLNYRKIDIENPAPYEHAQNGKAENIIQKTENIIQKVLQESKVDKSFWYKIAKNSCKIRNSMNSHLDPTVSRNEKFGLRKTDLLVTPMIPFGSRVLAHIPLEHQTALSGKCFETIMMDSADGVKGGVVLRNMKTNRDIVRRTFKVIGPGQENYDPTYDINVEIPYEEDDIPDINLDFNSDTDYITNDREYITLNRNSPEITQRNKHYFNKVKMTFHDKSENKFFKTVAIEKANISSGLGSKTAYFKYYDSVKYPGGPSKDVDYERTPCSELLKDRNIDWDDIRNRDVIKKRTYISCARLVEIHRIDFKAESSEKPPTKIEEARNHAEDGYFESFLTELDAFNRKGCTVDPDIDIKDIDPDLILQLIPLFQKKYSGTDFEKFKCRMVVLGNHFKNKHNMDTYASMVGADTLKLLLAIGASLDYDMLRFDIKEAYLSTTVDEKNKYYVRRPPGVHNDEMPYIMQPECFIYGHPLANTYFRKDLAALLTSMGAKPSVYDPNIWILNNELGQAFIPTVVDDMPTMYSGGLAMKEFLKSSLDGVYDTTVEDPLKTVLGFEVERNRELRTIKLRQRGSQYNLFNKYLPDWETMDISKFARIPKNPNGPLSKHNQDLQKTKLSKEERTEFQSIVGELNWINQTAPDFIYSTRCSARRNSKPNKYDRKEAQQAISCMAGIVRQNKDGLTLGGRSIELLATTDTSYHGFSDLKSCTGGTFHMNSNTGSITSLCEKHTITTDSAMAAEGVGAHLHIKKILPILYLFEELGLTLDQPAKFYMDNVPFMQTITGNRGNSAKSKHMLIRLQVTKEAFQDGKIILEHLPSEDMVADILTKALAFDKWSKLRDPLLGNSDIVVSEDKMIEISDANFIRYY
jgi:hypothetical protein